MGKKNIYKNMSIVGLGTLLSRVTGLVRDQVMAIFFGATASIVPDAYYAAFKIPNSLRNLFAEGGMTAAFLPTFKTYLQNDPLEAKRVSNVVFTYLSLLLLFLTVLGIIFSPQIIFITASGFLKDRAKFELAVLLLRIFFPYLYLIAITALATAILNSFYHFLIPSITPVLLNISIIIAAAFSSKYLPNPIIGVAIGVLIGGVLQLSVQIPLLIKKKNMLSIDFNYRHPALKKVIILLIPTVFTFSIYEITTIIEQQIASNIEGGTISVLYYANRLYQLPLAVFAIALSSALLPALSEAVADENFGEIKKQIHLGIKTILSLSLPSAIFLFILSEEIFEILFQYGKFSYSDTLKCASALRAYALGLVFISTYRIFSQVFYALKDTKTPAKSSFITLIFFSIVTPTLTFLTPLGFIGLPLGTALATIVNFSTLLYFLNKKLPEVLKMFFDTNIYKILFSSILLIVTLLIMQKLKSTMNLHLFFYLLIVTFISFILILATHKFFKISIR